MSFWVDGVLNPLGVILGLVLVFMGWLWQGGLLALIAIAAVNLVPRETGDD